MAKNLSNILRAGGGTNPLPVSFGGTGSTSTTYCSLTTNVSGTLPIANGGTGATSAAAALTALGAYASGGALGTPSSGTLGACTVDGTNLVGYLSVPQNSQSVNYTLVASDASKHLLHPATDTTARTFTIPANSSVAYPIGTTIVFVNQNGAGVLTIAITSDIMRLAGAGTTGTRSIAANGVATAIKIASTEWIISGTNLT